LACFTRLAETARRSRDAGFTSYIPWESEFIEEAPHLTLSISPGFAAAVAYGSQPTEKNEKQVTAQGSVADNLMEFAGQFSRFILTF
jgi:hypothetical protein